MRRTDEQTLSFGAAGPIRRVEVAVHAGALTVSGAADGAVRVRRTIRWVVGKPHATERVEDGVLRIDGRIDHGPLYVGSEVSYHIELPAGVALQASTDAGAVDIEATDAEVQVRTGAGEVSLTRVGGDVRASTRAGAVRGTDLAVHNLVVETSAGAVTLTFSTPPEQVEAHTVAGGIDVTLPDAQYSISVIAEAGRAEVGIPHDPAASRRLVLRSKAGSVRVRRG